LNIGNGYDNLYLLSKRTYTTFFIYPLVAVAKNMNSLKRFSFRLILIISPFLLLGIMELLLRIVGLFQPEPLFLESYQQGKEFYQLNPYVARRYFNPKKIVIPTLYPETFEKNKSPHTYRIFCLGESSMAGFPFDYQVPFPQQLRQLLSRAYPDYRFEVINFGLSAINSFSVLDLLPEMLEKQPDLLLIYLGHNEFYGAYGSASVFSLGENGGWIRFYLRLQKLRLLQMLKAGLHSLSSAPAADHREINLMEEVIADKKVLFKSNKYQHTLRNFEQNLQIIYEKSLRKNVPVIIGNLVSNIRDLPPFSSEFLTTDSAEQQSVHRYLVRGDSLLETGMISDALKNFQLALQADSGYARSWYQTGKAWVTVSDTQQAFIFLTGAKDRDVIRFRASEDINQIIQKISDQFSQPWVNLLGIFRRHSLQGLIGYHLICDHLHPNPQGYYLLALGFYEMIHQRDWLKNPDPSFLPASLPYGVTELDWNIGLLKIYKMTHRWPFPEKKVEFTDFPPYGLPAAGQIAYDYLFNHQNWGRAHYDMAEYYLARKEYRQARWEYLAVNSYFPDDPEPFIQIARSYRTIEKWDSCEAFYQRALERKPGNGMIFYQIAIAQWRQKKLSSAITNMEKAGYAPDLNKEQRLNAKYYLAGFLGEADKISEAETVLKEILRENPQYAPAYQLLSKLNQYKEK
jgi:tetratricopeptide (TPR) repeat protein